MKGNLGSSRKKKTIALIATAAVLLVGAVTGVTLFLKDDGSASAADLENEQLQGTDVVPDAGEQNNEEVQTPGEEVLPGEDDEQATGEEQENEENEENNEQSTTEGTTAGSTAVGGVSTREPVQPQEFITYRDRLVSEDFLVGWTPISIATIIPNVGGINRPILEISKESYTIEPEYNAVRQGEIIFYEITVANVSKIDAESIRVIDKIPQGTTLEQIDELGKEENGIITWILDIPALTEVKVKFIVRVNEDAEGNAENIAIVNGDKTNKVVNPIIITQKISEVYRNGEKVEAAKVGDTIKYSINIKNTGSIDGITKVTDKVPTGTTLIEESLENATVSEDGVILWEKVEILAGEEKTIEFEVIINDDVTTSIKNIATVSQTPTNEVEDKIEVVDKVANKDWANDAEILRAEIEVELLENGEKTNKIITLSAENNWEAIFENLAKYDSEGNEIEYTVIELTQIEGYTSSVEGMTITNTYEEPTIDVPATKVWEGDNANLRPASITVQLLADGEAVAGKTLELNANNSWTATFEDLQKYHDLTREAIEYSVAEVEVPEGYTSSVEGMTITNTYEEPTIEISIIKNWEGENGNQVLREAVVVELLADNQKIGANGKQFILNSNNQWKVTRIELPKYQTGTKTAIDYTVVEKTELEGYTPSYAQVKENGVITQLTVTNTYEAPTVEKTAIKTWAGEDDSKVRPSSITVQLLANGTAVEGKTATLPQNGKWEVTFDNLPRYVEGTRTEIEYSIQEISNLPEGYVCEQDTTNPMHIINTYTEPKVEVPVLKVWEDNDNEAGKRPNSVTVQLLADGVETGKTLNLNAGNNWTSKFTNLNKYKYVGSNRSSISYSVQEIVPNLYEEKIEKQQNGTYKITNTYKEITRKKESTSHNQTLELGSTINYTITIGNPNNKNAAKAIFKDTVPTNTELTGNITVTTTGGTTNNPTTITKADMEKGIEFTVPGKGTVKVQFTVKILKSALGSQITNTAKVDNKDTETILTNAKKGINIYQVESTKEGQKAIIVIDMSLSMASAITPPTGLNSDYMAYAYNETRWAALTRALDAFIDSFFATNAKNQVYICGYNDSGIQLMSGFATSAASAKASYANVFTEKHFKNVVEAAKVGENVYNNQHDGSFTNNWSKTGENYNIDVDALTYLSDGKWHKSVNNTSIKAGDMISQNAEATTTCLLGSGTDITDGLTGANSMIDTLEVKDNVNVIIMSDGEDNRQGATAIQGQSKKIYDNGIDLYTVAFTNDANGLATNVGTGYITQSETADTAGNLKTIFEKIADKISEKDTIVRETTTKYISMSDVAIADNSKVTIFTGTRNAPNKIEEHTGSEFKAMLVDNQFDLSAFLLRNSNVDETDTINIEVYTKK